MKSSLTILIKCVAFTLILQLPHDNNLYAQDCKNYIYMTNNAEVQMTIYDKTGAVSGIQTLKISNVKKGGTGFSSTVTSTLTDEKGAEIAKGSGVYKCDGGKLMADMRISLPQDQAKQLKDMEGKLEESYIEYPAVMSVGMKLPDALFNMKMNTNGIPSTMQFEIKNRIVTYKGNINIAGDAGWWNSSDTYAITYDAVLKIKIAGIGIPVTMKTTEYFVPGFGIVATETVSKKGKPLGNAHITKVKK